MREQQTRGTSSSEYEFDFKNALILFGILLLAVVVGFAGLAITGWNEEVQNPGAQNAPAAK
ncbi:MAG TPA: hypothetical protein VES20_07625 [Bryobacteraceae bacterium]|nr:hypothetical protein [Bryobacteraceae bacterium]